MQYVRPGHQAFGHAAPIDCRPSPATQARADRIGAHFRRGQVRFRRDLRHIDRAALHYALRHCREVRCTFIFEREFVDPLPVREPPRYAPRGLNVRAKDNGPVSNRPVVIAVRRPFNPRWRRRVPANRSGCAGGAAVRLRCRACPGRR
ncbi:hypothetical protein E7Z57_00305 [Ralstonia pseudosolanacearum]|uniref:Photolyase/cryptochrome alpha/beta domain-containing protein n=1 Tax=Ralstonia solanacearum TaxID=305 RepID=A0AA92ICD0_RALSL|nr:hypothetical protein E7Z57_00305 [Ralstonia pseudosolanacearum]